MKLIDKEKVVAEIYRLDNFWHASKSIGGQAFIESLRSFIKTLKVIDPYAERRQYDSVESGIKASAETYSFNIESQLFNQLPKEQQGLWRKEIEEAYISGAQCGVDLAKDPRYKENGDSDKNS
jgi:hypothetical protein